jgi:adenosylcobyric acid synthase
MFQGTGSNVGKSTIVAGLARAFRRRGLRAAPFKPQNMSNNAAAVAGGEIGRAQALQARAAGIEPSVDMNPVLIKPEADARAQLIVQGRRQGALGAGRFNETLAPLLPRVMESFSRVCADADLVLVEGAGSPAEINLRRGDIANMGFAMTARVPVVLVGDIDRGGVIASLVGTHTVLPPEERALIRGFAVNKFRGCAALFDAGAEAIARLTGWPFLGLAPWFADARLLPAEDAVDLASGRGSEGAAIRIAVPLLPHIANFDDLDPLRFDPHIQLAFVPPNAPLPGDAALVILPGSKSTIADLAALRRFGWDVDILAHRRRGGAVLGLCGGYQMLGGRIRDPDGAEGPPCEARGLGLLEVETELTGDKVVRQVTAADLASGLPFTGYEIHAGRTGGPDAARAPFLVEGRPEGAASADGRVVGVYLHGLLSADAFRSEFLRRLTGRASQGRYEGAVERILDGLADHLEAHLDLEAILNIARSEPQT